MRGITAATTILLGIALAGAPAAAPAQPAYGQRPAPQTSQAAVMAGRAPNGSAPAGQAPYAQQTGAATAGQRPYPQPYAQGGYSQASYVQPQRGQTPYGQGAYGQQTGQGAYGQAGYGQQTGQGAYGGGQAYAPACAEDDDLESLSCHHRRHSPGGYRDNEHAAYLRGDHYRGYQDDGAGRRRYDRGGYGVGHDDYTGDYAPLRGY